MASTLLDKLDESLKCDICLENFRSPRGLPCLHSFCEKCLERWAKKSDKPGVLTCPNCSKDAQIPEGGVTEFPAHFLVNSLQESVDLETTKEEGAVCGLCDNSGKPTSYCVDCDEFMCDACHSSHKKIKVCKDHQVVTIDKYRSGTVAKPLKKMYCDKHDEEQIKFYCETCDKLVCRDCIVMKKYCRDHEYCTLNEAAQSKADCLRGIIKECQESKKKYQSAIQDVEKLESSLIEKLSSEKKDLKDIIAKIDTACDLGTQLTDGRSDMEILSNYATIMVTLQEANKTKPVPVRADSDRVSAIMENPPEASNTKPVPADIPVVTYPETSARMYIETLKQWVQVREFSTQGDQPIGITTTPGDDIAILCTDKVKVFSQSGDIKHSFSSAPKGSGITCMLDGKYVIAAKDANKYFIYIYDAQGKELSSFLLSISPGSVAIDNQGNVIVGESSSYSSSFASVCIHSSTGNLKSKFRYKTPSDYDVKSIEDIVVTAMGDIAVTHMSGSSYSYGFNLVDSSGQNCRNIQQPPVNTWCPQALCYSKTDDLIFVTKTSDPKGVYMYTGDGGYLKCVTNKIGNSCGLTLSQDGQTLIVANRDTNTIKIFRP